MKKILLISFLFAATFAKGQQGTVQSAAHIVLIGGGLNTDSAAQLRSEITDTAAALRVLVNAKSPIASPTFTGTVTIPTPFTLGATSVTVTGTQLNSVSTKKEIYNIQALTTSPVDATDYYFGQLPKAMQTTSGISKIYFRKAGTITGCNLYTYAGTAGTNESWTISLRLNNTTDYTIATVALNTAERVFNNSSMSITVAAGDYIEVHSQQVTWATNPASVIFGGYIEFQPN